MRSVLCKHLDDNQTALGWLSKMRFPEWRQRLYGRVRFGGAFCGESVQGVTALILTEQAVVIGTNKTVQSKEAEEERIMDDQGGKVVTANGWLVDPQL